MTEYNEPTKEQIALAKSAVTSLRQSTTQQEREAAIDALRTRLERIFKACFSLGPKQAVGEMVQAMLDMPEWKAARSLPPTDAPRVRELQDARRYQWLREQSFATWKAIGWNTWNNDPNVWPARDAAIDAALARHEGESNV